MSAGRFVVDESLCYEAFREAVLGADLGRTTPTDIQQYVNCIRDHVTLHHCRFRVLPHGGSSEDAPAEKGRSD